MKNLSWFDKLLSSRFKQKIGWLKPTFTKEQWLNVVRTKKSSGKTHSSGSTRYVYIRNSFVSYAMFYGQYPITAYQIISYHISYRIVSYCIVSYRIVFISYHIISYHIISYHIISYHVMSCHVMPCLFVICYCSLNV